MLIRENVNLRRFNTFHVSAHARYFAEVVKLSELREALAFQQDRQLPFMLIGQGSNLLFKQDFPGLVIELNIKGIERLGEDEQHYFIKAQCGEIWHDFVLYCLSQGYYGLENLSLIPGTVGAAPVQNIGAYGVEVADFVEEVEALDIADGTLLIFSREDCELGYRDSVFKNRLRDQFIITSVTFSLLKVPQLNLSYPALQKELADCNPAALTPAQVSEAVCRIRRSKLPDSGTIGNAGSFFWNPVVDAATAQELRSAHPDIAMYPYQEKFKIAAAWLIDKAGWKGYREGDVGVHRDHALVLVNYGEASGSELYELSLRIQASVKDKFGIALQPEVRII